MRWLAGGLLAVALGAGVLVVGIARSSYPVTATFTDVRGLVAGAEVRAGGIRVGRVDSIALGRDGLPRVGLSIDRSYVMHAGGTAAVCQASLSGEFNGYVS